MFSETFCFRVVKTQDYMKELTLYLPNDKFLDWFKLKTFADHKLNLAEKLNFVLGKVENVVGEKGENAGYQYFLLFPTMFPKGFHFRVVKSRGCVVKS